MKKFFTILIIFFEFILFADQLYLQDSTHYDGKIIKVSDEKIDFINSSENKTVAILGKDIKKITFSQPENIQANEKAKKPDGETQILSDINLKGKIFSFPLKYSFSTTFGFTSMEIFDTDDNKVAEGQSYFKQYKFDISYQAYSSGFYLSPSAGYFHRTINVRDFSYSIEGYNEVNNNFIPGEVTSVDTGDEVSKEDVYSLKYNSTIDSIYFDSKLGYMFILSKNSKNLIINLYGSVSLVEYQRSVFEMEIGGKTEKIEKPFDYTYLNSGSLGYEFCYFNNLYLFGISLGYERRIIRKYDLPEGVMFNEIYEDPDFNIKRTRQKEASYSRLTNDLYTLKVYFLF